MSAKDTHPLEWTGERYVPQLAGNIRLEHLHRYLIARELSRDKRVLDIACGEGYGADLLATVAAHVVGVDVAPEVIAHARSRYVRSNLEFSQGQCEAIPLPDHSVDVVVSFETLEHVSLQDDMLREIGRVLRPDGLLVMSNPERHEYSDVGGIRNPHHVKELYRNEFERLLRSRFRHVAVCGQRVRAGSIVGPLDQSADTSFVTFPLAGADAAAVQGVDAPLFLLALASDQPVPIVPAGLLDGGDFVWVSDLENLLSQVQGECAEEISRRLGDSPQLAPANIDAMRMEFIRQADRVSDVVASLAAHVSRDRDIERALGELEALKSVSGDELGSARLRLRLVESQLLEANARLAEANARLAEANAGLGAAHKDLSATRAMTKAHAAAEEWLERKTRSLESTLETERRLWRDRDRQLTTEGVQLRAELAASRAEVAAAMDHIAFLQRHVATFQSEASQMQAQLAASRVRIAASQNELETSREMVAALQIQVASYEQSRSWRITAPLRAVRRLGHDASPVQAVLPVVESPAAPQAAEVASRMPEPGDHVQAQDAPPDRDVPPVSTPVGVSAAPPEAVVEAPPSPAQPLPKWVYEEGMSEFVPLESSAPVETRIKLIAFYLPQFHPIPENDAWWGKGFTEWTSVTRAKPQFEGHYQPHLPGELGFYDVRLPDVQPRQIELAKMHGIHGFCYYHYWFHGRRLLRRPLDQVLARPELDFPFCLCWANENWTRRWDGQDDEWLIGQQHTPEDDLEFIRDIEPALRDSRYIRVDGRPLLLVYRPALFPDAGATAERWRVYCRETGLGELFLMSTHAFDHRDPRDFGFDAALEFVPNNVALQLVNAEVSHLNPDFKGNVYDYQYIVATSMRREAPQGYPLFRSVMPMWDNEARRPRRGNICINSSPARYREWLESTCRWTERHVGPDRPLVFVNAWNEWAEGAHLEPDRRYGYAYLRATAEALRAFPPLHDAQTSLVAAPHAAPRST
jgi:SAM-dependent methyltransferase